MRQQDQQERFENVIADHRGILFKVVNLYGFDAESREDLSQEIVMQLWKAFPRFDSRLRFSTWMYRISLNVAISFSRRERSHRRRVVSDGEPVLSQVSEEEGFREELLMLREFRDRLDPLSRGLLLLHLDGNGYAVIADVLGISETNVATRLTRLRAAMKAEFGPKEFETKEVAPNKTS